LPGNLRAVTAGAPAFTRISAPLRVDEPEDVHWDDECDIVIVGFGGAGAACALEALDRGGSVIAVDRFEGGGSTAFSGGTVYAGGTRHQHGAGFADTAEEMLNYLLAEGSAATEQTLRAFCEQSAGNLEWLERHGVPFGGNPYLGKTAYPPDGHWLFFSGNEMLPAYRQRAVPAPRGHRTAVPGFGGEVLFARLRDAALARGVRLLRHAPVRRLIVDGGGRVIGIEASRLPEHLWKRHNALFAAVKPMMPFNGEKAERAIMQAAELEKAGEPARIRARAGVVLATGSFIYNRAMVARHREVVARNYAAQLRIGSMGCDGSGIELGQSAGGKTALMDQLYLGRPISPPEAFVQGLLVNAEGRRFVNEDAYQSVFGERISRQPGGGRAWLVVDRTVFWTGMKQALFPGKGMFLQWGAPALVNVLLGGTRRAKTLRKLARKCGMNADNLESTVEAFAACAAEGKPDPLGKSPDKMRAFGAGPFYAINCSLDNRFGPAFASTSGGLLVDEGTGGVLGRDSRVIPGLYAAGRAAVGVASIAQASGVSLADNIFSGRRAARSALPG